MFAGALVKGVPWPQALFLGALSPDRELPPPPPAAPIRWRPLVVAPRVALLPPSNSIRTSPRGIYFPCQTFESPPAKAGKRFSTFWIQQKYTLEEEHEKVTLKPNRLLKMWQLFIYSPKTC